jgi:xanthine permease XanP
MIFLALSFTPKLAAMLAIMPRAVMASALLFAACFIVINGLQVITSRMLDARRTLVIGLGLIAGAAVEAIPAISGMTSGAMRPIVGSSLVFGTLVALVLNLIFRIGLRRSAGISIDAASHDPGQVEVFLRRQGAGWGARADIVSRALFGVSQLVEAAIDYGEVRGPLQLQASFDEFNLDVRLSYEGVALAFPQTRPSFDEIQDAEDGTRLLAGFLIRRNADSIRTEQQGALAVVTFHFDH